jgi:hypothetical protein
MIRYNYNRQVNPPAPFVHVHLSAPLSGSRGLELPAQIDTGADVTVVPESVVKLLALVQLDEKVVAGFGGLRSIVPTYLLRLHIESESDFLVEVLTSGGETHVLLGRDVINRFRVRLDGPGGLLEIE